MQTRSSRADTRGRSHSPKRRLAPKPPPPRDCPSPLPKMVSTADVTPSDHHGWLIDQLRGRKVWCAVSDMLFCVFEKEDSRVSKQVILLPGCKVKAIEFKSASQDGRVLNEVARRFASKTVSGVDKYQFLIENASNRQKVMFGVPSKQELDAWMSVLENACHIDLGSAGAEETVSDQRVAKQSIDHRNRSKSPRGRSPVERDVYSPTKTLPSRLDVLSLSMTSQTHDVSKDSVDHIRRRIRKECLDVDQKPNPMRVSHDVGSDGKSVDGVENANGKEGKRKAWYMNIKSPFDILNRRKRSSSADDVHRRRKLFPMMESSCLSNPFPSPRLSDSQPSLASSIETSVSDKSHDSSFSGSIDSKEEGVVKTKSRKKRGFLSRSLDRDVKPRTQTHSGLHRTASDLKDRIFSRLQNSSKDGAAKSRSAGVKMRDLQNPRISGALQYKIGTKWIKVWCLVCRGSFYAFKSHQKDEASPVLTVVLNQCRVTYTATRELVPGMFVLRLSQAHCKNIYLSAGTRHEVMAWLSALRQDAPQVDNDDMLLDEIKDARSSRKKKGAKEWREGEEVDKGQPALCKRYSCPDFAAMDPNLHKAKQRMANRKLCSNPEHTDSAFTNGDLHGIDAKVNNDRDDHDVVKDLRHSVNAEQDHNSEKSSTSGPWSRIWTHENGLTNGRQSSDDFNHVTGSSTTSFTTGKAADSVDHAATVCSSVVHSQTESLPATPASTARLSHPSQSHHSDDAFMTSPSDSGRSEANNSTNHDSSSISAFNLRQPEDSREEDYDQLDQDTLQAILGADCGTVDDGGWSNKEFLLGILKDKLRHQLHPSPSPEGAATPGDEDPHHRNASDVSRLLTQNGAALTLDNKAVDQNDTFGIYLPMKSPEPGPEAPTVNASVPGVEMEGYLEVLDSSGSWNRQWCTLHGTFLWHYESPSQQVAMATTGITGRVLTQQIDEIPGKRFVLRLAHKTTEETVLSLYSRDELEMWHTALEAAMTSQAEGQGDDREEEANDTPATGSDDNHSDVPLTQAVKQKLLTEMLRQKMELEKMQAVRKGTKEPGRSSSMASNASTPTPWAGLTDDHMRPLTPSTATMDENVRTLSRLQQRRMSTQIKLQTIKKLLESPGGREKRTVFQIGRKQPDLIQSHELEQSRQSDLVEQVRSLSSKLQRIDCHLSTHATTISPRYHVTPEATPSDPGTLRHSFDPSMLNRLPSTESGNSESSEPGPADAKMDEPLSGAVKFKEKLKSSKGKDVNRSNSLKSSIQRFAHRTFARANWSKVKKSMTSHRRDSNGVKGQQEHAADGDVMERKPDVIYVTADKSHGTSLAHAVHVVEPPSSFKTEDMREEISKTSEKAKKAESPRKRFWSKLKSSNSFNTWDRLNSRLQSSASSPCLNANSINETSSAQTCASPLLKSGEITPVPKLDLGHTYESQTSALTDIGTVFSSVSRNVSLTDRGTLEIPDVKDRIRSSRGFLSAREKRTASCHDSDRNSWTGKITPRKEVNPNVLAEIQAFEELSSKFLGS